MPDYTSNADLINLTGKTAVVTGSGKGMGVAIARRLAEAGATVIISDIDLDSAKAVAAELTTAGWSVLVERVDVREPDSIVELADFAVEQTGRLDIWVNNAGIYPMIAMFGESAELWDQTMNTNLRGVFIGTREAARRMIAAGSGGVIVNITSIAADRAGHPAMIPYAASKAGVKELTRSMAAALGRFGVRVVGLSPGVVITHGMIANMASMDSVGANTANRGGAIPMGRPGQPDDIGRVVLFLASGLAEFVTGETLAVDGGDNTGGRAEATTSLDVLGWTD